MDETLSKLAEQHSVDLQPGDAAPPIDELRLIPAEEREAPDQPAPEWLNLNPIVNAMADAQDVEVGSRVWRDGGMAPRSGDSGEQNSYGWSFAHRLTDSYRRGVLANYGHRRCYYLNAPFRQFGYDQAGRPHEWSPESPGDHPKGPVIYETSRGPVRVSGPDAEHFWLTPLFALVDDKNPIEVKTGLGYSLPSNIVARLMASLLVSSAVGTVRNRHGDGTSVYPWTFGDRATGRLLHTMVEGLRRGLMLPEDVPTATRYIMDVFLPFYERAPGIHEFGIARPGTFPIGMFNGFYWSVPVVYDAMVVFSKMPSTAELALRFKAILKRWAQWAIDMDDTLPGRWYGSTKLHVTRKFAEGADGKPVDSLAPFFDEDDFEFGSSNFEPWAFRCVDICAKITGDAGLAKAREEILARHAANPSRAKWLVDADGSPAR